MIRRLPLSYLAFALLILVCLELPMGYIFARGERLQMVGELEHQAEILGAYADSAIRNGEHHLLDTFARQGAEKLGGDVLVVDQNGGVLASSRSLAGENLREAPELVAALSGSGTIGVRAMERDGTQFLSVAVPTEPGPVVRGAVRLTIPTASLEGRIHKFWLSLLVAGLTVLTAVAIVAVALARWISQPIRELEQATAGLAAGALTQPAPTSTGPPELRRLAATFNRTAQRLQKLIESQQSFTGHASHQLKTPLAALRLRLENLEPDVLPAGQANLSAAATEIDRLSAMIDGLLMMARLDEAAMEPEPTDLDRVIEDRVRHWEFTAARRRVRVRTAGTPVGVVWAVPGAIEQIIDNLVANALNVSPPKSTITVGRRFRPMSRAERHRAPIVVEMHVIDEGPGLRPAEAARAFDRFWRAPGAPKGGTGLGLALVAQLAEASGGRAVLLPAASGGVDAVVTFPAATHPAPRRTDSPPVPARV